ncbi:glycosidase [Paenarthrobacter sp. DKR-5]|uniref:pullulanase X25 domain-containing protein n=1 Tax=Paenarthrobacter sp. DKR-5 TaxID=2835535 RepID=UPI001BDC7BF8|nr:glycosidase [Paenarthrobacter sp. DKR-5]MBT1004042.1 glycosidase [Paenarthrobacter sp. DKR-5]
MGTELAENTDLRLKAVLEILAAAVWAGESPNAGMVLAEALTRVPPNEKERELLSGGIPRGHKNLTAATARLVKAGWLSKGKGGWAITDDGLRAIVTFRDPAAFAAALAEGRPVPEDVAVPTKAPRGFLPKAPAKRTDRVKEAAPVAGTEEAEAAEASPVGVAAEVPEKPAARRRSRKATAATGAPTETVAEVEAPAAAAAETFRQPDAVAIAGDFGKLLGAPEDWAPQYDEVQMAFDPADQLWKLTADLPAGFYQYKVALNRSWDENYGAFGIREGANHELHHGGGELTIRYDQRIRDVTSG